MKYLKQFETLNTKNIIVGDVYVIDTKLILTPTINDRNMSLGRIINRHEDYLNIKTFLVNSLEEYEFLGVYKNILKRKATKQEILDFEAIENSKKFNI